MPPDLETRLRALAADAELPPAPPGLAAAVRSRVAAEGTPRRGVLAGRPRRPLAIALAALLLVPAAAVAAIPDARNAVLDWVGLRAVEVRTAPAPPSVPPREVGSADELGRRVSLADARASVRFRVRLPTALGTPARVYAGRRPAGGRVSLVYETANGRVLVTQFRGGQTRTYIRKSAGPNTTIEPVRIGSAPGLRISGAPHGFLYEDAGGEIREETGRLAGNVLLWERDGVVLRLEGRLSRAEALSIGRSFR